MGSTQSTWGVTVGLSQNELQYYLLYVGVCLLSDGDDTREDVPHG